MDGEFGMTDQGELDLGLDPADAAESEPPGGDGWSWDEWVDRGWEPGDWWTDPENAPDDQEAWLAGLPDDIRAEYEAGPFTGAGEGVPAGFLHRDRSGPAGVGFAAGGVLDALAPGPWLAEALAAATARGYAGLGESELIGVLCAWRRLSSWAAAGEAAAVTELSARRAAQAARPGWSRLADHVTDEVAAALTLTGRSAARLQDVVAGLARLPSVHGALERGAVDWAKACVFADELAPLDDPLLAGLVAGRYLDRAEGWTTGQLRAALRRAVLAADPQAAGRRQRAARKDAAVAVFDELSGNAGLAGRELPPAEVLAADARLTALARWLQRSGAPGTLAWLRAAVYTALLTGRPLTSLLHQLTIGADTDDGADANGDDDPDANGDDDSGADSAANDHGTADAADTSRDGASCNNLGAAGDADVRPDGLAAEADGDDSAPADADGMAGAGAAADAVAAGWPAVTGTIHLTMPLSAFLGGGEPGEVGGHGPVDAATSRELAGLLASNPQTRWCLTLTGAGGTAAAHACARNGPVDGQPVARWAAGLRDKLQLLETGTCSHRRQAAGYVPPAQLRHLIQVRQRRCGHPGCRRPAARCDIDHTVPWDQGGRTCECNLAPLCRSHHGAKQAPGWSLDQPEPGELTWRLPSGRTYLTTGDRY